MPYTPTNWQTGDVVTSEKLNKIEQELANPSAGTIVAHVVLAEDSDQPNRRRLDITLQDLISALNAGKSVVIINELTRTAGDATHLLDICASFDLRIGHDSTTGSDRYSLTIYGIDKSLYAVNPSDYFYEMLD